MADRKQIALLYYYDVNWIGGTYYILNIIKALKLLPDAEKPYLTIYHDHASPLTELEQINYPYINYVGVKLKLSRLAIKINNIAILTIGKALITVKLPSGVDNFYYRTFLINNSNIHKYYCWIPDLQDLYLPHFFKRHELRLRMKDYERIVAEKEPIVFSSNSALNDFNKFYPNNTNLKKVLRFVSISASNFNSLSIVDLKNKFRIKGEYFIVSNQFWRHKNHLIVLEAFNTLLKKYPSIQLVLTGKEYDYRNPDYTTELKKYVSANNLQEKILFLGFIDRDEQLKLMSASISIIQPSLFEGWSTVVEDAKFLNKKIICSDISVHKEQLPGSDLFFDPHNASALVEKVEGVLNGNITFNINYNHEEAVLTFAKGFVDLF